MLKHYNLFHSKLEILSETKLLISTINAYSYNVSRGDSTFCQALHNSDILLPDGISIVMAIRWLTGQKLKKITGADLFYYELARLQKMRGKCFFLGSSNTTLKNIKERLTGEYPDVQVQTYSPPYKHEFSSEDNSAMITAVNVYKPDVLFIGMTAPKQEKWAYAHREKLDVKHICCIGAVFDFYAGTVNRAPKWMIKIGMEWFFRLIKEPRRMWYRYIIGNPIFICNVLKEKLFSKDRTGRTITSY
jgi:N-acetylglucosaminyldiphosphoundecaprenol N-acetyl-beta-D-mannosaminyltransferase